MKKYLFLILFLYSGFLLAQLNENNNYEQAVKNTWISTVPLTSLPLEAPTDGLLSVSINENNHSEYIVAFSEGGLYITYSKGKLFNYLLPDFISSHLWGVGVNWVAKAICVVASNGIFYSEDLGYSWERAKDIAINEPCDVRVLSETETILYTYGTAQKAAMFYKTTTSGKSWEVTFTAAHIGSVVALANNSNELYMSSRAYFKIALPQESTPPQWSIYKSSNAGASWELLTQPYFLAEGSHINALSLCSTKEGELLALTNEQNLTDTLPNIWQYTTVEAFAALTDEQIMQVLWVHNLHHSYNADSLRWLVANRIATPAELLSSCGSKFLKGEAKLYRTINVGENWQEINSPQLKNLFLNNSTAYGAISQQHNNQMEMVLSGNKGLLFISKEGNESFLAYENLNTNTTKLESMNAGLLFYSPQGAFFIEKNSLSFTALQLPSMVGVSNLVAVGKKTENLYISAASGGIWLYNGQELSKLSENKAIVSSLANEALAYNVYGKLENLQREQSYFISPANVAAPLPKITSLVASFHNPRAIYATAIDLLYSVNGGKTWSTINPIEENTQNSSIIKDNFTAVAESALQFGLLYSGTYNGKFYVSYNAGGSWKEMQLPANAKGSVVQIVPSIHSKSTVYVLLHSSDGNPLIYKSENEGKNWQEAMANLPYGNVNSLLEDTQKPQLLYLGTQSGAWISFDGAESYHLLRGNLKRGAVRAIAPVGADKIALGTASQGVFVVNIVPFRTLGAAVQQQVCYPLLNEYRVKRINVTANKVHANESIPNEVLCYISAFAKEEGSSITLRIVKNGVSLHSEEIITKRGFNYFVYNLEVQEPYVQLYHKKVEQGYFQKAINGKYYLPRGSYKLVIEGEMFDEVRPLVVE